MKRTTIAALIAALIAASVMVVPAMAQEGAKSAPASETTKKAPVLSAGDDAPALSVAEWVKGDAITGFEKGRVYVVEFWATWCGPCIASMPHLTELQKEFKDRGVTIIGVSSEDQRGNTLDAVKKMVASKGETMGYTVAWDDDGKTSAAFMKAAKQRSIPCSFVVDQKGKIAYIGHPMGLDAVLAGVVAGKWDYVEGPNQLRRIAQRQGEIMGMVKSKPADALTKLNALVTEHPYLAKEMADTKYALMVESGDAEGAKAQGAAIVDKAIAAKNTAVLNEMAWNIVDPKASPKSRDVDLALRAAVEADRLTEGNDPAIIDTLARCYWIKGDKAKAVELQKKAISLAKGEMKTDLEETLEEYTAGGKN